MALGIEAREASTTIVLIFDIDDDLGSRSPCAAIDVIRIGHSEIGALRGAAEGVCCMRPKGSSPALTDPSMIMPGPRTSWA